MIIDPIFLKVIVIKKFVSVLFKIFVKYKKGNIFRDICRLSPTFIITNLEF